MPLPPARVVALGLLLVGAAVCVVVAADDRAEKKPDPERTFVARETFEGETHLSNVHQLTDGGENAEAYWSSDAKRIVFQATRGDLKADQIFVMGDDGSDLRMVTSGIGRTTCAWFMPGDERVLFASTHRSGPDPRPTPRGRDTGYVWPVWSQYDLFTIRTDGTDLKPFLESPGYDAEATVSPKGDRIVFTSSRDGDLEIYTAAIDGTDVKRLTNSPGYDGGAVFSWDGKRIAWRAARPDGKTLARDKELLLKDLVKPERLDLYVMDADGSNVKRLTDNGAANFGPFWHPDGRRIIFCSNLHEPTGFNFELYLIDVATGKTERVTHFAREAAPGRWSDDFDGFPMFSHDGKRLLFCSNRFNSKPHETNVFVADWKD